MHVHHFLQDKNQWIAIFDQIGTARMIVSNEQLVGFDAQSDIGDHSKDVDNIFQHKMQLQVGIKFAMVVGLLRNAVHQCGCLNVL